MRPVTVESCASGTGGEARVRVDNILYILDTECDTSASQVRTCAHPAGLHPLAHGTVMDGPVSHPKQFAAVAIFCDVPVDLGLYILVLDHIDYLSKTFWTVRAA